MHDVTKADRQGPRRGCPASQSLAALIYTDDGNGQAPIEVFRVVVVPPVVQLAIPSSLEIARK